MNVVGRYLEWLHTGWPAGTVEKLPDVREDGTTRVPGVRVVGDLTGVPLLKFAADSGARAVQAIREELAGDKQRSTADSKDGPLDLAIVGAGVAGLAAALEAKALGLRFEIFEAAQPFSTVVNFPKAKPIFTYPTQMRPEGQLQFTAEVKEDLVAELERHRVEASIEPQSARVERMQRKGGLLLLHVAGTPQPVRARHVVIAIGRSGNFRKLGVPGEGLDKVSNRLHDPKDYQGKDVLVVGGGDSAIEAAVALTCGGANVTLSYRRNALTRAKPDNLHKLKTLAGDAQADVGVEQPSSERVTTAYTHNICAGPHGSLRLALGTTVTEIRAGEVDLAGAAQSTAQSSETIPNDVVFAMIGREPPLDFFRRSGIPIRGEWRPGTYLGFALFVALACFVYLWKSGGTLTRVFREQGWFPFNVAEALQATGGALAEAARQPASLLGTLTISAGEPSLYYSLAYSTAIVVFGVHRIRRRKTPYVSWQTLTLMAVQVIPLFLLPYVLLPWAGHNGWFDSGLGKTIADNLLPVAGYGHGREYWRAFGLILAWPLFIWNVFSGQPMTWWLVISLVQTFVIIPWIVRRWGKGAYCGWICSCGALAETMGDAHRHKMPHGPRWSRVNAVGQVILAVALLLLVGRVISWAWPATAVGNLAKSMYSGLLSNWSILGIELNYYHVVDITLAGIIGVGFYFWFSGRVWCRFACPLAALMHIYARFSRFRIFADKKKCISCNVCTSVCHQGIDIMSFAQKGIPMEDPQCVRCSACVQGCPTGVLAFGHYDKQGCVVYDRLRASPVQIAESGS